MSVTMFTDMQPLLVNKLNFWTSEKSRGLIYLAKYIVLSLRSTVLLGRIAILRKQLSFWTRVSIHFDVL